MKSIPTLYKSPRSVDIENKKPFEASFERSDICAVLTTSIIGESVLSFEIVRAFLERYAGDSMDKIKSPGKRTKIT